MLSEHDNINDIVNLTFHQLGVNVFELTYKLKMLFNSKVLK
jgi:hypothetical protein